MNEIDKRLEEIRERAEDATPGPWSPDVTGHSKTGRLDGEHYWEVRVPIRGTLHSMTLDNLMDREDAQFISHARDDIPWLLGVIQYLQDQLRDADTALSEQYDAHNQQPKPSDYHGEGTA